MNDHSVSRLCDQLQSCVNAMNAAHESLFSQCASNGMKNAWGKDVDCSAFNQLRQTAMDVQAHLDLVKSRQPGKRTFLVAWELSVAHVETGERRQFTQTAFIELQPGEVFGPAKVSEVQKIVLQGMIERDPRLLQLRATAQVVSFQQLEDE